MVWVGQWRLVGIGDVWGRIAPYLRCDIYAFGYRFEGLANGFFRAVAGGRIDQVDAQIDSLFYQPVDIFSPPGLGKA